MPNLLGLTPLSIFIVFILFVLKKYKKPFFNQKIKHNFANKSIFNYRFKNINHGRQQ